MKQPDVIALVGDDLGRELFAMYRRSRPGMERYGNTYTSPFPYPLLPNLDALARNGVTMTSCVVTPVCSATRAAALTGLYQFQNGLGSLVRGANAAAPTTSPTFTDLGKQSGPSIRSIAHHAKANGYHCIATGKWHLFLEDDGPDLGSGPMHPTRDMGFDRWDGTARNPQPNFTTYLWYAWDEQAGAPVLTRETSTHLTQKCSEVASAAFLAARAENPGRPIFHWIAFNAAHAAEGKFDFPPNGTTQHNFGDIAPPDEWSNTRIRAGLEHLDYWIGQYFDSIGYDPDNPTEDDPVVFFWGDNGTDTNSIADAPGKGGSAPWPATEQNYPAGHPGWSSTGGSWNGSNSAPLSIAPYDSTHFKGFVYVDGTTVPLLFAGNPRFVARANKIDEGLIDVVDFFPTLAEIMGASKGTRAEGSIDITGTPAAGDTIRLNDGFGGVVTFEWTTDGSTSGGNTPVLLAGDLASSLQAAVQTSINVGLLRLQVASDTTTVKLTHALRGYEGNQAIQVVGTGVLATRMSGGTTEPPSLAGTSFARRLLGPTTVKRTFSGAGAQYAPNGLLQERDFELRSFIREDGENRWALLHQRRVGIESVEFYNIGQPAAAHAQGTIRLHSNLQDGDNIRITDDFRHDAKDAIGLQVVFTARSSPSNPNDFLIGAQAADTLSNLHSTINNSVLALTAGVSGAILRLTHKRASYCGNDAMSTNAPLRIELRGMSGGAASDQRQTCDLNSQGYRDGNGVHPELAKTLKAENSFLRLGQSVQVQRTAQVLSGGVTRSATGGAALEIEGVFEERSTFRVFDILVGNENRLLQQSKITSWDLQVQELDPATGLPIGEVLFSQLGMDPAGVNADGFPYIAKQRQSSGGWDTSLSRSGYIFRYDADTRYFAHSVGKIYSFRFRYATPYDGATELNLAMKCSPSTQI